MRTSIYYFSGTGNSPAAASKIAAALGNTGLEPITSLKACQAVSFAMKGRTARSDAG